MKRSMVMEKKPSNDTTKTTTTIAKRVWVCFCMMLNVMRIEDTSIRQQKYKHKHKRTFSTEVMIILFAAGIFWYCSLFINNVNEQREKKRLWLCSWKWTTIFAGIPPFGHIVFIWRHLFFSLASHCLLAFISLLWNVLPSAFVSCIPNLKSFIDLCWIFYCMLRTPNAHFNYIDQPYQFEILQHQSMIWKG